MRGFGASSEGRHMFQRKVYDGAMRTLTEYRRHLDGRSSDTAVCHYGIADLVAKKVSGRHIANAFRSRPGRCRCAWHCHHRFAGKFELS